MNSFYYDELYEYAILLLRMETNLILETYTFNKKFLVEYYLVEDGLDEETAEEEANEFIDELEDVAEDVDDDNLMSAIVRFTKIYDAFKKVSKNKFIVGPLVFLLAGVRSALNVSKSALQKSLEQDALQKVKEKFGKPLHELVGKEKLKAKQFVTAYISTGGNPQKLRYAYENAKHASGLFSKFKAKFLGVLVNKFHIESNVSSGIINKVEELKYYARIHPVAAVLFVVTVMTLFILTVFHWSKIKRFLKAIGKMILAPFKYVISFIKKLLKLEKQGGENGQIEYQTTEPVESY